MSRPSILQNLLGRENVLIVPVALIKVTGDHYSAMLLNQIVYWSSRTKCNKEGYFYKTVTEWEKELFLSNHQVRKAIANLKNLELIHTKIFKANGSPTLHYRVNFINLENSVLRISTNGFDEIQQNQLMDFNNSITEITTDINKHKDNNNAFDFYQQNFGVINPFIAEEISHSISDIQNEELVIEAMKRALSQKKQWNYAKGIIKSWIDRGIKTKEQVAALDTEFQNRKVGAYGKTRRNENIENDLPF